MKKTREERIASTLKYVTKVLQTKELELSKKRPATEFYDIIWDRLYFLNYNGWYQEDGYVNVDEWNNLPITLEEFCEKMSYCKIRYKSTLLNAAV